MQPGKINTVAILGGGPAASTLATLLARAGKRPVIFHLAKRTPLVVGESLVPAIIPMLRLLGVEEQVKGFSTFKPGATVNVGPKVNFSFPFDQLNMTLPKYAYNVPRDKFDEALLENAKKAGAKVIEAAAKVERVPGTDRVRLSDETLKAAGDAFGAAKELSKATDGLLSPALSSTGGEGDARSSPQPDLIVDATGRFRLLPKLLELPSREGPRKDTALFAHVDQTQMDSVGHVHTTRLDNGWSWRIPLPGRVSVGVVIGTEFLPKFGATKEERFDNLLKQDSVLCKIAGDAKRLTPVVEYTNYQLVSSRVVGDGWALVGDTAGFIDPVFSSGLFIGMQSAVELADAIGKGTSEAFKEYERHVIHHLKSWHEIVEYFYNGRLFTCFHVGQMLKGNLLVKLSFPHLNKHFGRIFSGAASTSAYSLSLLRFAMKYGLKNEDPKEMMVH
jgi:flavin-dependent dehydrogenase